MYRIASNIQRRSENLLHSFKHTKECAPTSTLSVLSNTEGSFRAIHTSLLKMALPRVQTPARSCSPAAPPSNKVSISDASSDALQSLCRIACLRGFPSLETGSKHCIWPVREMAEGGDPQFCAQSRMHVEAALHQSFASCSCLAPSCNVGYDTLGEMKTTYGHVTCLSIERCC